MAKENIAPIFMEQLSPARVAVKLRTLVWLRWAAIAGQLATLLVVRGFLNFELPLDLCLLTIGALAVLNLALHMKPATTRIGQNEAAFYLIFDTMQLTALLYLTGGLQNPFSAMILGSVTIAAAVLSGRAIAFVVGVTFACLTFLAFVHHPLPWRTPEGLLLERLN
jgi:two-component system sensor histidine kinase RegB